MHQILYWNKKAGLVERIVTQFLSGYRTEGARSSPVRHLSLDLAVRMGTHNAVLRTDCSEDGHFCQQTEMLWLNTTVSDERQYRISPTAHLLDNRSSTEPRQMNMTIKP